MLGRRRRAMRSAPECDKTTSRQTSAAGSLGGALDLARGRRIRRGGALHGRGAPRLPFPPLIEDAGNFTRYGRSVAATSLRGRSCPGSRDTRSVPGRGAVRPRSPVGRCASASQVARCRRRSRSPSTLRVIVVRRPSSSVRNRYRASSERSSRTDRPTINVRRSASGTRRTRSSWTRYVRGGRSATTTRRRSYVRRSPSSQVPLSRYRQAYVT